VKGLLRTSADNEVWLAASANRLESLDAIRTEFKGIVPDDQIVTYRVLDDIQHSIASHRWRKNASELLHQHFLANLDADVILYSSIFEGLDDDIVTSSSSLFGDPIRAVVAYDLIPLSAPEHYIGTPQARSWYFDKLAKFSNCDLFLAISAAAGREVVERLGIDVGRLANIMAAADDFAPKTPSLDTSALDQRIGILGPFFIYTASFEPRKNFENLIAAFGRVSALVDVPHQLILVTSGPQNILDTLRTLIRKVGLSKRDVIIANNLSDDELKQLYHRCVALVYPSLHEGFGLPILEAMQCEAPTIGSNTSSIPEIIGLQEAMFDPNSVDEIAEKMIRVIKDHAFRDRLKQNAQTRRRMFSWDKTASMAWTAMTRAYKARSTQENAGIRRMDRYRLLINELNALTKGELSPGLTEFRVLANSIAENIETIEAIPIRFSGTPKRVWRIEGPFDSNCSLALLNRETARALKVSGEDVVLHSTESPGDYPPNEPLPARNDLDVLALPRCGVGLKELDRPLIVSRNAYPPRVQDMNGDYNFLHLFAWKESGLPSGWVDRFNLHLDGITCLSSHVMKVLQDNGVTTPLIVSGCGVDHWDCVPPSRQRSFPGKSFRFLHVSSCSPSKGADALLVAYGKAFRGSDDVTLLIKTFESPHNDIESQLAAARAADNDYPDVVLIFDDLSDSELKALYRHSHVLVAPSRAEGFGSPIAQAMLVGIPVITTAWSGQLDFCNKETAWLVDYSFAPARTPFELFGSVWAEPDIEHLATRMSEACRATTEQRARKAEAGRSLLLKDYTWGAVVGRLSNAVTHWTNPRQRKPIHIGWVSTFNCRSSMATYSQHVIENIPHDLTIFAAVNDEIISPDDRRVVRTWHKDTPGAPLDGLGIAVDRAEVDTLVIQFDYDFFEFSQLEKFIRDQRHKCRTVVIELHSTVDPISDYVTKCLSSLREGLKACNRVLVHSHHDLNRLKAIGIVENATLFPHDIREGPLPAPKSPAKFSIAQLRSRDLDVNEKLSAAEKGREEHSYEKLAARLTGLLEALHQRQ